MSLLKFGRRLRGLRFRNGEEGVVWRRFIGRGVDANGRRHIGTTGGQRERGERAGGTNPEPGEERQPSSFGRSVNVRTKCWRAELSKKLERHALTPRHPPN